MIGISNSSEKFPEQNWKSGLPLKGYSQGNKGQSLSNTAEAFRTADPKLIPNTDEQDPAWQYLNFGVANEKTVYSVPVLLSYKGWSVRESLAPIGILTISGSHPGMIDSTLRRRAEHLAILLGFIFYLHSKQNPDQPGVPIDIDKPPLPVGFKEGHTEEFREFLHRAVSLRREVAGHFEQSFINRGVHNWDGKELSTTLTP